MLTKNQKAGKIANFGQMMASYSTTNFILLSKLIDNCMHFFADITVIYSENKCQPDEVSGTCCP